MNMKELAKRLLPLLLMMAVLAAFLLPQRLKDRAAEKFGEPLFSHALPAESKLVQKDAATDDEGGTTAALLLQTDLSSEDLIAFYSDMEYPPAKEGQTVKLSCKALDDASIDALKQADLYEEGANYQFVYLYSK